MIQILTLQSSEQWLCSQFTAAVVSVVIMVIGVTMGVTLVAAVSMERQRSFFKGTQMECGARTDASVLCCVIIKEV